MDRKDEIENIISIIGYSGYMALIDGEPLQIWRGSTPHNWFIEDKTGRTVWHSDEGKHRKIPSLKLFNKKSDSEKRNPIYWGSDSGKPRSTLYILKNEYRDAK